MLKSLEMFGFKSFADRSRLDFSTGINCVVGPNGSGKSNVVDAMKWILGDQSAKSLRGKEMTDVIFNGSASRKPSAFAEATLTFDNSTGLLPLDIDLGYMASPRMVPWVAQGVYSIARPWPGGGALFTTHAFTFDFADGTVTWPGGQTVPMIPGRAVEFPARACDACPQRAQCTTAKPGHGRTLTVREDEQFQQKLRAKLRTKRGRAALRKRTAVEHAISHQLAHQGRRARYKGLRKNQFDGRRHAAVSNLQVAARYAEERRLAS